VAWWVTKGAANMDLHDAHWLQKSQRLHSIVFTDEHAGDANASCLVYMYF